MPEAQAVTIRMANSADIEQIANLQTVSFQSAYKGMLTDDYLANRVLPDRLSAWRKILSPEDENRYSTLLAYQGEMLVGFICAGFDAHNISETLIESLHVHPSFKRGGIGRVLMQRTVALIEERRPDSSVYLLVYEENTNASAFYDKLGGEVAGRELGLRYDGQQNKYFFKYAWHNLAHLKSCLLKLDAL